MRASGRMTKPRKTHKKLGRPPKATGGLTSVLFVRMADDMSAELEARVEHERTTHPNRSISKSDIARELIAHALRCTVTDA